MSSNTKVFEDKMKSSVEHLSRELAAVRAGRANPAVLDKVVVDYYGAPTPIQQLAAVAVSEARTLTITPWDRTLLRPISKAIIILRMLRLVTPTPLLKTIISLYV